MRLFHQTEQNETDIALAKLNSKKAADRTRAETHINALGDEAVDALLASLRREAAKKKRERKWYVRCGGIYVLFIALMTLYLWHATGRFPSELVTQISSMSAVFGSVAAGSQIQKNAAKALVQFDDVRAVGPLAEALAWQDKDLRILAEGALTRLLPRMQASDAPLLNADQRARLYAALAPRAAAKKVDLTCAILKAMEQVGDEKATEPVERLVDDKRTPARLRLAATESLPAIRQRAELARAASTLLRPSEAPANDKLLRPASGVGAVDEALLLRPSCADE